MDDERLNRILLHLGNAVLAQHQSLQEVMAHINSAGDQERVGRLLASQEKAVIALQQFVSEVDTGR